MIYPFNRRKVVDAVRLQDATHAEQINKLDAPAQHQYTAPSKRVRDAHRRMHRRQAGDGSNALTRNNDSNDASDASTATQTTAADNDAESPVAAQAPASTAPEPTTAPETTAAETTVVVATAPDATPAASTTPDSVTAISPVAESTAAAGTTAASSAPENAISQILPTEPIEASLTLAVAAGPIDTSPVTTATTAQGPPAPADTTQAIAAPEVNTPTITSVNAPASDPSAASNPDPIITIPSIPSAFSELPAVASNIVNAPSSILAPIASSALAGLTSGAAGLPAQTDATADPLTVPSDVVPAVPVVPIVTSALASAASDIASAVESVAASAVPDLVASVTDAIPIVTAVTAAIPASAGVGAADPTVPLDTDVPAPTNAINPSSQAGADVSAPTDVLGAATTLADFVAGNNATLPLSTFPVPVSDAPIASVADALVAPTGPAVANKEADRSAVSAVDSASGATATAALTSFISTGANGPAFTADTSSGASATVVPASATSAGTAASVASGVSEGSSSEAKSVTSTGAAGSSAAAAESSSGTPVITSSVGLPINGTAAAAAANKKTDDLATSTDAALKSALDDTSVGALAAATPSLTTLPNGKISTLLPAASQTRTRNGNGNGDDDDMVTSTYDANMPTKTGDRGGQYASNTLNSNAIFATDAAPIGLGSGNGSSSISSTTSALAGGIVGGLAGVAALFLVALTFIKWYRKQNEISEIGDGPQPGTPTSPRTPITPITVDMAERTGLLPWNYRRTLMPSPVSPGPSDSGERGFQRLAGRKLPSAFSPGMSAGALHNISRPTLIQMPHAFGVATPSDRSIASDSEEYRFGEPFQSPVLPSNVQSGPARQATLHPPSPSALNSPMSPPLSPGAALLENRATKPIYFLPHSRFTEGV